MKVKKVTMIWCPANPRSYPPGHMFAGHVEAANHGDCDRHGTLSIPRAGTVALADSKSVWRATETGTWRKARQVRNFQLERYDGGLDAKVGPESVKVRFRLEQ